MMNLFGVYQIPLSLNRLATPGGSANMAAQTVLEFLNERTIDAPGARTYLISEVSAYPTEAGPAKRGRDWDDNSDSTVEEVLFSAYPNPFNESIVFEMSEANAGSILIMDLRGVIISSLIVKEKQTIVSFDGRGLAAGVYFASFVDQSGQPHTLKIIKY